MLTLCVYIYILSSRIWCNYVSFLKVLEVGTVPVGTVTDFMQKKKRSLFHQTNISHVTMQVEIHFIYTL